MNAQMHLETTEKEDFSQLLTLHHRELLVYARTLTQNEAAAKDIAQDAFVTAWEKMSVFDVTKDFTSWMRGIIRNKWREWIRKNNRSVNHSEDELECYEAQLRQLESTRTDGGPSIYIRLESCLGKLPEGQLIAIQYQYRDGMKSEEAAEKLSINSSTLRKRVERARQALKQCMQIL